MRILITFNSLSSIITKISFFKNFQLFEISSLFFSIAKLLHDCDRNNRTKKYKFHNHDSLRFFGRFAVKNVLDKEPWKGRKKSFTVHLRDFDTYYIFVFNYCWKKKCWFVFVFRVTMWCKLNVILEKQKACKCMYIKFMLQRYKDEKIFSFSGVLLN